MVRARWTARRKIFILLADLALFILIASILFIVRVGPLPTHFWLTPGLWAIVGILLSSLYIFGTYDLDNDLGAIRRSGRWALALTVAMAAVLLVTYVLGKERTGIFGRGVLLGTFVIFAFASGALRMAMVSILRHRLSRRRLLLVTDPGAGQGMFSELQRVGRAESVQVFEQTTGLEELLHQEWDAVFLAGDLHAVERSHGRALLAARLAGTPVVALSTYVEEHARRVALGLVDTTWFVMSDGFALQGSLIRQRLKRLADVGLSVMLLAISWPFMLLTAIAVRLDSPGSALFRQQRVGKDGREFTILKFRSMRMDAEKDGARWASAHDDRTTRVGRVIRKTRLDELPQLWNVLRGDMSFVGPRPERPEFCGQLSEVIPFYDVRHLVRPGVTGWAQVMYPYGASIEDARNKLEFDLYYIKNYSLTLDLKIVLRTVRTVLFAAGR